MRRYELSDAEWAIVSGLFPANGRRGGQWADHRIILNGICFKFRAGVAWRDVPERYGPWQTLYGRFRRWTRDGFFLRMARVLQLRLDQAGMIAWDLWCVDGTHIRAARAAAGGGKRGAPTSRRIMRSAAVGADSARRSTSSPAPTASRSVRSSPRGSGTSRRSSRP